MINNEDDAKKAVLTKYETTQNLQAAQLEDEPDYWLVTPTAKDSSMLIGGVAYVVNRNGAVFVTSGSLPPRERIEAAKSSS